MSTEGTERCVHFTGIGIVNVRCRVGVAYETVRGEKDRSKGDRMHRFPCLSHRDTHCAKAQYPTPAEAAEEAERVEASLVRVAVARQAVVVHAGEQCGVVGVIPCPHCAGRLQYSIAAVNAHIWGRCDTAGCVRWME